MKIYLTILLLFLFGIQVFGQDPKRKDYIQVDGIVYDDEGYPVRYVNIISRAMRNGTDTDENGIFSLISVPGDTLLFTTIGYKPGIFIMPKTINYPRYSIDIELLMDTINIGSVLVLPWRTYGEFVTAVIDYVPPEETMIKNMEHNLALIERQIYENMRVSPEMGYTYAMRQETERVFTSNQTPVNNLLNPFAWAKFFDGIKNGLFKNKKSDKTKKKKKRDKTSK